MVIKLSKASKLNEEPSRKLSGGLQAAQPVGKWLLPGEKESKEMHG